jgi:hypothetical protein
MQRTVLALLTTLLVLVPAAIAETYKGIGPLDTLGDIKLMFPNADFEKLEPAWAQPEDVLYRVTGRGMSGTIVVKFYDERPSWRLDAAVEEEGEFKTFLLEHANRPDESITVDWVRWIPDALIPLQRLIAKYGMPEERGFADEDLQPYRHWVKRGLTAYLSDDEKSVQRIDFHFTDTERCAAWRAKHDTIPPFMAERCKPKATPKAGRATVQKRAPK